MARSVRHRRKVAQDRLGIALIVGALLVASVAGAAYFQLQRSKVTLDRETLCPTSGPVEKTVVLFDATDKLNAVQSASIRKHLEDVRDGIKRHASIEVYSIGWVGKSLLEAEISVCNPGRGEDIDPAFGNPRLLERKWRDQYAAKINAVIGRLTDAPEAKTSPILESIQSVAISAFAGESLRDVPKRLIIVSDLIQHTAELSHYSGVRAFPEFRQTPAYRRLRADLRGVDIKVLYVSRENARLSRKAHIEFWQAYFADTGAQLSAVTSIEG
jgi:hypothetical protein